MKPKDDIWKMIKTHIPIPFILSLIIYALLLFGGAKIYSTLTANENLSEKIIEMWTCCLGNIFIVLTVIEALVCICLLIYYYKTKNRKFQQEKLTNGKIDALIVEQDEPTRDKKFIYINQNVKKTYWVLGVSLTSIVEHENTLEKMASDKINIRLCMMNPDIAVDGFCLSNMENNTCVLNSLLAEIKNGTLNLDNVQEKVTSIENCNTLLELYHVLINVIHFNEYYVTATDYKDRIKSSYNSLKRIKNSIEEKYGQGLLDLKVADSFIPMSMTIADACEDEGRMIVEFHLPFTQYKILFEITKKNNNDLFDVFVNFYNTIWKRAQENE